MGKVILLSKETIWNSTAGKPFDQAVMYRLAKLKSLGHTVCIISSRAADAWVSGYGFLTSFEFGFNPPRKSGDYVDSLLKFLADKGLAHTQGDIIVLGATVDDFLMATNSLRPLLSSNWATGVHGKCKKYGLELKDADDLENAVELFGVQQSWYFKWAKGNVSFFSLSDGNTLNKHLQDELAFAADLKNHLKNGAGANSREYILRFLACLLQAPEFNGVEYFAVVPSSASANVKSEVMYDYLDQARYVLTKKRHDEPILFRHTHATQRKTLKGAAKTSPKEQIDTLQINPHYKGRLNGNKIVLLDDYMTNGVSLSVSIGLLLAAGASEVVCVTMGKFGTAFVYTEIAYNPPDIYSNSAGKSATVGPTHNESGRYDHAAHKEFVQKFKGLL